MLNAFQRPMYDGSSEAQNDSPRSERCNTRKPITTQESENSIYGQCKERAENQRQQNQTEQPSDWTEDQHSPEN